MNTGKSPQNYRDIIKALHAFLIEPEIDEKAPLEQVKAELERAGLDIPASLKKVRSIVDKAIGERELREGKEKRIRLGNKLKEWREKIRGGLIISEDESAQTAVAYRKLESSSEEDVQSLLEDDEIIRLLNMEPDDEK